MEVWRHSSCQVSSLQFVLSQFWSFKAIKVFVVCGFLSFCHAHVTCFGVTVLSSITVSLYFLHCSSSKSVCSITVNLAGGFLSRLSPSLSSSSSLLSLSSSIKVVGGMISDSVVYIFVAVRKGHLHLVKFSMSLGDDLVIFIMSLLFCLFLFIRESSKAVGGTCGGDW